MKKNTLSVIVFGAMFAGATLHAQELTKEPVRSESYASAKVGYHLRNQKAVQDAFQKEKSVYVLDFSSTISKSISPQIEQSTNAAVTKADYVSYSNTTSIQALLAASPRILSVQLPFKNEILVADLVKSDLFGDGFKVSTSDATDGKGIKTGLYYQGMLRGKNAMVTFSFFEDEFSALIITDEEYNSIIEAGLMRSQDNTERTHVIYADDDLKVSFNHPCETEKLAQYQEAVEQLKGEKVPQEMEKATLKCVTYYWETQYNLYQQFGSAQSVTNYMTTLFNNFQLVYNNESIGSKLNQVYVWTTADSYNNSLDNFSANRSNFNSNLAVLFSRTGGGGVAWLNTVCQSGEYYRHAFCGSMGSAIPAFPNYSWPLNVTTHEVGHNLGSPHTHACSWTGGAIDGCGAQAGYSEGCTGPIPSSSQKGTIMSYCHLLSNVGINIANGFGPQPGNLIRSRVNSCITLTCETDGGGGGDDPCVAAFEPNESLSAAAAITIGTTNSAAISTSTDKDYFRITTSGTNNITYNIVGPSGVDYDVAIYNSGGTQIGTGTSSTATETIALTNQAAGTYYIYVYGYNGANSKACYTVSATATPTGGSCATAFEPNESLSAAATISYGASNSAAISSTTDRDYFKVVTTAAGNVTYKLTGPSGVDYDLRIYNSAGSQIGYGMSATATETVTINNQPAGTYYAYVYGYNGANSSTCYTLRVAAAGSSFSGEEQTVLQERINAYPNPTSDKLILGGTFTGKLMNQLGQIVMEFKDADQLSLEALKAGVYILQVEGVTEVQRIVKQ